MLLQGNNEKMATKPLKTKRATLFQTFLLILAENKCDQCVSMFRLSSWLWPRNVSVLILIWHSMWHLYVCNGHWNDYFLQPRRWYRPNLSLSSFDVYGSTFRRSHFSWTEASWSNMTTWNPDHFKARYVWTPRFNRFSLVPLLQVIFLLF